MELKGDKWSEMPIALTREKTFGLYLPKREALSPLNSL